MSDRSAPASRDFVEHEIRHLREVLEQRLGAMDAARKLQAREYRRRLKALNHAHDRALEAQAKTVPREVYDIDRRAFETQFGALRDQVLADVAAKTARATVYSSVLAIALVVIGWVLMWFRVRGG